MPVQTQNSSFAAKMGNRVAQANAEHKDKPIDTGIQQLPAGIKNGTAITWVVTQAGQPEESRSAKKQNLSLREEI